LARSGIEFSLAHETTKLTEQEGVRSTLHQMQLHNLWRKNALQVWRYKATITTSPVQSRRVQFAVEAHHIESDL